MNKISVLTPSFNSGKYIERAILSVIKQNYASVEHIIMDGGSTDNTLEILNRYPHIVWKSEKDNGQSDAMNKAFDISSGAIIVYLNADDYFEENIFELIDKEFESNGKADMIVGNGIRINTNTGVTETWYSEIDYIKCLQFYKYQFPLNPVSYFYRRSVQEKISYNLQNHYTMDFEFILRAYQIFNIKKVEKVFGYFSEDGNNKTSIGSAFERTKATAIKHCIKFDKLRLLIYVSHFSKKKLFKLIGKEYKSGIISKEMITTFLIYMMSVGAGIL